MNESSRWRGWLVAAAIFVLGVSIGVAGTAWTGVRLFRRFMQDPAASHRMADRAVDRIGNELAKKLQLTPEEATRVRAILTDTAGKLKEVRVQAATQAKTDFRSAAEQIARTLPREKRADFYRLIAARFEHLGVTPPEADPQP